VEQRSTPCPARPSPGCANRSFGCAPRRNWRRRTSLTKIVDEIGLPINRLTAWRWRHRLLAAHEPKDPERLGGIVEVDGTLSSSVRLS
jgi:hypothetical protein